MELSPDPYRRAIEPSSRPERRRALFVQDYIDVARPHDEIARSCSGDADWLAPLAVAAASDGADLLVRIGPDWAAGLVTREVRVRLGSCRERGRSLVVPIEWEAVHLSRLFPVLAGDIELAPLEPVISRLVLSASYAVPLGELGRRLDEFALHRVAESTVRSFLRRLAVVLERSDTATAVPSTGDLGGIQPGLAREARRTPS